MFKRNVFLTIILLSYQLTWAQKMVSNKSVSSLYQAKAGGYAQPTDSSKYYLIKCKNLLQLHQQKVRVLKRLSAGYYVIASPFAMESDNNVEEVAPANALWKASDNLVQLWQKHPEKNTPVKVDIHIKGVTAVNLTQYGSVDAQNGHVITFTTTLKQLPDLLAQSDIVFATIPRRAHEEIAIDDIDLGVNTISAVKNNYPEITGLGINVSVKENRYDNDLDLLGRSFNAATAATLTSGHATTMATLIGGSGNTFITGTGAAPQVRFTSSDFSRLMPDEDNVFKTYNISIQNHSYGTGIENYYGAESVAYDRQILELDTLVHVFSSGNVGTSAPLTGAYAGLKGIATLSGDFKQAKNVLVVGGTGRDNVPQDLSSGGPAYDGRIKPELVADGEDGTSGAAALVSGTVALLQQAYKQQYHRLPSSALIKSVLINAADDIGAPAVDFKTGYGKLNALEALRTLKEQRFRSGSIGQHQETNFTITVPANCRELKVTLVWNDVPAVLNAPFALVNDLDLTVSTPAGEMILPWTLSTYPSSDSLLRTAQRKRDTINNVEHITLQNPAAGTYTLRISGSKVATGSQAFYVSYQTITADRFEWIYPSGPDPLFAASENYLRWQSTIAASTGKLSVSYDHGANWQTIHDINLNNNFYVWTPLDVFTQAMLKMEINGEAHISKEFTLSKPLSLNVGYNCTDGTLLHWNAQPNSTVYNLYTIKNNILQKIASATDTTLLIPASQQASPYFAVSAAGAGFEGLRSYTINVANQGVGCYVKTLLANVVNNTIVLNLQVGSVANLKSITWEKLTGAGTYTSLGISTVNGSALTYTFTDPNPKKGTQYYRVKFTTTDNRVTYTELASADYLMPSQFVVYPNPASAQVNILSGDINNYEFKLYDASGKLSFTKGITELQNSISLSVGPGVYVYVITLNGKVVYQGKLIKV